MIAWIKSFLLALLTIFSYTSLEAAHHRNKPYDLVICALFRNESLFLKEWIEFHKMMGVQHFYLYNNLSTDNYLEILSPYIEAGEVELFDIPLETYSQKDNLHHLQLPVYRHALRVTSKKAKWAAFIDLDEFLFPVQHDNLISLLKEYEQFPGLVVNWQNYGTGGVDSLPPEGLVTESLLLKMPTYSECNHMVKSIVQPRLVEYVCDPHYFVYKKDQRAVNSNHEAMPLNSGRHPSIAVDKIRINHYWFGTRDWFIQQKLPRRAVWGLHLNPIEIELLIASGNIEMDASLLGFAARLRQRMFAK